MVISIKKLNALADLKHVLDIRRAVFVEEQGVAEDEEVDGKDPYSTHFLLYYNEAPIATARVRQLPSDDIKIERVAVLKNHRGQSLGKALMKTIIADIRLSGDSHMAILLSSQISAIPFYEKLGFSICGEEYLDAGILHRDMYLSPSVK